MADDQRIHLAAHLLRHTILRKTANEYVRLSKEEKKALGKKFEHSVSDHLPIWVRIPRPGFAPPPSV